MSAIVSVKGLTKKIGRKQVLKGLNFELEIGRVVGILGPNGAGKTTLGSTKQGIKLLKQFSGNFIRKGQ